MNIQELIKMYEDGYSLNKLSVKHNIPVRKIRSTLVENEVPIRNRSQQNVISNQLRGKKVNHEYFDVIDLSRKAYILGFFAADGCVSSGARNSLSIGLSSIDRELLERIKIELDIERDIADFSTNKGYDVSRLVWSSANHKIKMAKHSIVPQKSTKTITMKTIPEEYKWSFLLGYYDGDGCFRNDGLTTCRWEICSYTDGLLKEFAELINSKFGVKNKVLKSKTRDNYYTLTYATSVTKPLLEFLYNSNDFYLERKYEKFKKWELNNRIK